MQCGWPDSRQRSSPQTDPWAGCSHWHTQRSRPKSARYRSHLLCIPPPARPPLLCMWSRPPSPLMHTAAHRTPLAGHGRGVFAAKAAKTSWSLVSADASAAMKSGTTSGAVLGDHLGLWLGPHHSAGCNTQKTFPKQHYKRTAASIPSLVSNIFNTARGRSTFHLQEATCGNW